MNPVGTPLKLWFQALRAPFFTASLVPVFAGASLAVFQRAPARWELFPLIVICSLLLHAATNLANDYYDFKKGVDKKHTFGSSRVLVDGLMQPKQILKASIFLFIAGALLGLVIISIRGIPLLMLALAGLLGGYFYSGGPRGLKYIGLGDILVFMLMGPLMVIGSFFALTGAYNNIVLFASIPIGALVAAILYANNLRDIAYDKEALVLTLAGILGFQRAKYGYAALMAASYILVLAMVLTGSLHALTLSVYLTLPIAIKNTKTILLSRENNLNEIAAMDINTAKLHFIFGALFTLSITISAFI